MFASQIPIMWRGRADRAHSPSHVDTLMEGSDCFRVAAWTVCAEVVTLGDLRDCRYIN